MSTYDFSQLMYAFGKPQIYGLIKQVSTDFVVKEQLSYELSGDGEHLWLWVEKTDQNTDWVATQLAIWADIAPKNVGYAGKKDRYAVTHQWFSLYLPGRKDPDFDKFDVDQVKIIKHIRHSKKLQTGGLAGNHFEILVRDLEGDKDKLETRFDAIKNQGVPNYFGEQRFGKQANNLTKAGKLFSGELNPKRINRNQRGMYLSAARSWIFNRILDNRIKDASWNTCIEGDVMMLAGSSKCFVSENTQEDLLRVQQKDIHPTGVLAGLGNLMSQKEARIFEESILNEFTDWQLGLENLGLKQERRALRVMPKDLKLIIDDNTAKFSFSLPKGCYATMVLRELLQDVSPIKNLNSKDLYGTNS